MGVNELSYSISTCKILEFNSELVELNSSRSNSLSSQVHVLQYLTRAARELNRV